MSNRLYQTKLPIEYMMLREASKVKPLDSYLTQRIQEQTYMLKRKYKSLEKKDDPLLRKLQLLGNNGEWSRRKLRELAAPLYEDKSPETIDLGQWISVEIECFMMNETAEFKFTAEIRKMGYSKFVTLKRDGSLYVNKHLYDCDCDVQWTDDGQSIIRGRHTCNNRPYGKEIVVTFKYGEWKMIQDICDLLRSLKCKVNKTCGLHVHFDCRHLGARQVTTLGRRIALCVPALKQMLPKSRSDNRFCQVNINSHRGNERNGDRYAFVNLMSYKRHKTLEIRGHSGTIDSEKIINWIKILRHIMDHKNQVEVLDAEQMGIMFDFPDELISYVLKRVEKFKQKTMLESEDDVRLDEDENSIRVATQRVSNPIDRILGEDVDGGYQWINSDITINLANNRINEYDLQLANLTLSQLRYLREINNLELNESIENASLPETDTGEEIA